MANIDKEKYNVQYGRIFIDKRIEELNTRKEDFVTFRYYHKKKKAFTKSIQKPYDEALTLCYWRADDGRYKNFLFVIDSNEQNRFIYIISKNVSFLKIGCLGKYPIFFVYILHNNQTIINNPIYLRSKGFSLHIPITYPPKQ